MKFNKITYGLISACGLTMTLTACQNDNDLGGVASGNYISVPVSTVITVPDGDDTRTTLNELAGNLQWKWEKGDVVLAIDIQTGVRGYLTAGEPTNDGKTAPFSGSINFNAEAKTAKLTIFYVGKGVDPASIDSEIKIDLENQDGKFESLVKRDVLWTGTTPATAVDVVINPTYTVINDFQLSHMTSAGHFQLKIKDGETLNNVDVTITKAESGNLVSPFSYKINKQSDGSVSFSDNGTEDGTIATTTSAQGDFYITMMPYGEMSMKFVATYNGKEYTGYLGGSEDFTFSLSAGQYLRSNSNNYGPLVIEMETNEPEVVGDDKILGVKWAKVNTRSWIDCNWYNDDAFYFSYIPGIDLETQGLELNYTTSANLDNGTTNPYVYHYQWGRNFGFQAANGTISGVKVPNYNNLPLSWPSTYDYYRLTSGTQTATYSYKNPDVYIYNNSGKDWCGTNLSEWPSYEFTNDDGTTELLSVYPKGFRLPTKSDFETLLPTGNSGETFTASNSFTVDGETIRPVYAKSTSEGTTVVWAILNSSTNYMALYELAGNYSLAQLNASLFGDNGKVIDYIDFPAHGTRSGTSQNSLQYYQQYGWYWASTSAPATGYAYMMRFDISGNNLTIYVAAMPKTTGMSVRCIYED